MFEVKVMLYVKHAIAYIYKRLQYFRYALYIYRKLKDIYVCFRLKMCQLITSINIEKLKKIGIRK